MRYDREQKTVLLPAAELAAYARRRGSLEAINFTPVIDAPVPDADGIGTAVEFRLTEQFDALSVTVSGTADTVITRGASCILEVVEQRRQIDGATPFSSPQLFARGVVLACLAAEQRGYLAVTVRQTFTKRNTTKYKGFDLTLSREELRKMFSSLMSRALPFARLIAYREEEGTRQISEMKFPYQSPREAQKDFLVENFRTLRRGGRLLVSAPTGTGKTMAALYPAVKALATGDADKIFYLTAKTVTGIAALNAVREMAKAAPALKCIPIYAKERFCPVRLRGGECRCFDCPLAGSVEGISYEERRDNALPGLLAEGNVFEPGMVNYYAEKYQVCPYELSLDASVYCDVVVCDYNYAFDPALRFRRYFGDEPLCEKPVFLVDEAHNLPDRAREMYSSTLSLGVLAKYEESRAAYLPADDELRDALGNLSLAVRSLESLCMSEKVYDESGEEHEIAYGVSRDAPEALRAPLETLLDLARRRMFTHASPEAADLAGAIYADAKKMLLSLARCGKEFRVFVEKTPEDTAVRLLCLDPGPTLSDMLSRARGAVFFSATLSPLPYFQDLLGCSDGKTLDLPSPYEEENLCIAVADYISTRLADRGYTAEAVAEAIAAMVEAKEGHYIAYFPSYKFLKAVGRILAGRLPDVKLVVQRREMSIAERDRFLAEFNFVKSGTVLGLSVLGGIFSEGIDLRGDRLIGVAVVGTGLGGLSSEGNLLEEYFEETREGGKEYAYVYPGINRVLQAAGRVIRDENDRGVVLLIDDRYDDPTLRRLLPEHWREMKFVGNDASVSALFRRFWNGGKA